MTVDSGPFLIDQVRWLFKPADQPAGEPGIRVRVGVQSLRVHCTECGADWFARMGARRGPLTNLEDGVHIRCAGCDRTTVVPIALLEEKL